METYNGQVRTPTDAIILFEACRLGLLPRVQRRLSEKERQSIRSGSVFVWDEREAGMRRWTDGKSWSASRVSGSFLTYREMEGKRGPGNNYAATPTTNRGVKTPDSGRNSAEDPLDMEEGPDGYRYKPDGLMKQSFSITTNQNQHLHLISYYSRSHPAASNMRQPSNDPSLASIQIPKGMYPESTVNDQSNTPAVTRSPMPGAPNYVMAPSPTYARQPPPPPPPPYAYYPGFIHHPSGYMYPISPMHTPPGYALHPAYAHPAGLGPMGHPPSPYGPPPPPPMSQAPPSAYDQRPLRNSTGGPAGAPPPPALYHSMSAPSGSLPPPPLSPRSQAMTSQYASQYPIAPSPYIPQQTAENVPVVSQIDPRLTEATSAQSETGVPAPVNGEEQTSDTRATEAPSVTSGQIPTIGRLVNDARTTPMTPHPAASNTTSDKEAERQGSTSPGGTKHSVPPQDIPSEKLGFREDMRALSKLDRVFARV